MLHDLRGLSGRHGGVFGPAPRPEGHAQRVHAPPLLPPGRIDAAEDADEDAGRRHALQQVVHRFSKDRVSVSDY